jgi:predicted TIM-barrel fold metal-dependent hydrolase
VIAIEAATANRIVDAHVHLFRRHSEDTSRVVLDVFPAEAQALAEDFLSLMDRNGVQHAVIVALDGHDSYLGDCLARWPDRFTGIGAVDPKDPDPCRSYVLWRARVGLAGTRTDRLSDVPEGPLSARYEELLAAMAERRDALWFYGPREQLDAVGVAAARYPAVPIVLNHLGFLPAELDVDVDEHGRRRIRTVLPPPSLNAVCELARFPNMFVVISGAYAFSRAGYPYLDLRDTTRQLLEAFGPDHVMWGSDFPASAAFDRYEDTLALVDALVPDAGDAARRAIMGGTATSLLGQS